MPELDGFWHEYSVSAVISPAHALTAACWNACRADVDRSKRDVAAETAGAVSLGAGLGCARNRDRHACSRGSAASLRAFGLITADRLAAPCRAAGRASCEATVARVTPVADASADVTSACTPTASPRTKAPPRKRRTVPAPSVMLCSPLAGRSVTPWPHHPRKGLNYGKYRLIRPSLQVRAPLKSEAAGSIEPVSGIEPLTCRLQDGRSAN